MSRKTPAPRLAVESVEGRVVPTVFTIADGDVTGLINALTAANTNNQPDTINLAAGGTYTLTTVNDPSAFLGPSGLPVVVLDTNNAANTVTVNGNGATITRSTAANTPSFRILAVDDGQFSANLLTLSNGLLTGALQVGAGIYLTGAGSLTLDRVAVIGNTNTSDNGGGIGMSFTSGATATITNSTIANNSALGIFSGGGGVFITGGVTATLTNVTVAGNTVTQNGGGVLLSGFNNTNPGVTVRNSIVANNVQPGDNFGRPNGDLYRDGGLLSAENNVIESLGIGVFTTGNTINGTNSANVIGADPILGPLANNGGASQTFAPLAGSPAIDTGNSGFAVGTTDQRGPGFARIVGPAVDIGALELQGAPAAPGGTTPAPTSPPGVPPTTGGTVAPPGPFATPLPPGVLPIAAGAGARTLPVVNVIDPRTGVVAKSFLAYDAEFAGGVNVAVGDVTGDGVPDIVTAPASDGGPDVRVFDGATGNLVANFLAYLPGFTGGVNVAVGDVDGDGRNDIVTGAGPSGGAHVRVFSGATRGVIRDFFAFDGGYTGGVTVAAADFDKDGKAEVVAGTQTDGNLVRVFSGASAAPLAAAPVALGGSGLSVAAGDVTGDGVPDVVVGQQSGGSIVAVLSGLGLQQGVSAVAYPGFDGGLSVAVSDRDGDGRAEVVTGAGPGGGPHVRVLNGVTLDPVLDLLTLDGSGDGGANV